MKVRLALIGFVIMFAVPAAQAAVSDAEFAELKQMLEQALERIAELEQPQATTAEQPNATSQIATTTEQVAANTAALEKLSWAERIRLQGDFRYRYQTEETSGLLDEMNIPQADRSRDRQRVRARAAIIADVADNVEAGLGITSGGDDPVSANQTLGDSGSSKGLQLDLAYIDWEFTDGGNLHAGKFKNQLVDISGGGFLWDGDWRPEGANVRFGTDQYYVNALGTWLAADGSSGSGNSFNYGVQAGMMTDLAGAKLEFGAGYFKVKADGELCFNAPSDGRGDDCFGNTEFDAMGMVTQGGGYYGMDYTPVELFAEASFDTAIPFALFLDYAKNVDARAIPSGPSAGQKLDSAYLFGGSLGNGKKAGEWQLTGYYQDKEADSVLGLLSDSDFAGGATDAKGYVVKAKYMLSDAIGLQATYLAGERQDSNGYENGSLLTSNPYDVDALQLDVNFKYK